MLSIVAVIALAAVGGLGGATSAPSAAFGAVHRAVAPTQAQSSVLQLVNNSAANDQYGEDEKFNSGRGNGSEGPDTQLLDPHEGEQGPGEPPTIDCDPGNSGEHNSGGD